MRNATSGTRTARPQSKASPLAASLERTAQRLAKRNAWLQEIDPASLLHGLFDLIPSAYFFVKNRQGELMFLSRNNYEHSHLADETAAIGLTDYDLNPAHMADSFARDDARIYATGEPILNHVELWIDRLGIPNWFVVNKMPLRSRTGEMIGIMGFSQNYEDQARLLESDCCLAKAVTHLREHYSQDITIRELSRLAGQSVRQLERKFRAAFGLGPQQFLIKTRLLASCRALLKTAQSLSEIAYACGFSDQSAFARHFRQHLGMTPRAFRQRERRHKA